MGTMALVLTPEAAFALTPQGERPLPPSMRERMEKEFRHSPLFLLRYRKEPTFNPTAVGTGKAGAVPVELVAVEYGGETVTLGIDPASGRVLTVAYRGEGPSGAPGDIVQTLSDFRDVNGVMLPFKSVSTFNGEPGSSSTSEAIVLNSPIDQSRFERPKTPQ
jgi:hypothetical protein